MAREMTNPDHKEVEFENGQPSPPDCQVCGRRCIRKRGRSSGPFWYCPNCNRKQGRAVN